MSGNVEHSQSDNDSDEEFYDTVSDISLEGDKVQNISADNFCRTATNVNCGRLKEAESKEHDEEPECNDHTLSKTTRVENTDNAGLQERGGGDVNCSNLSGRLREDEEVGLGDEFEREEQKVDERMVDNGSTSNSEEEYEKQNIEEHVGLGADGDKPNSDDERVEGVDSCEEDTDGVITGEDEDGEEALKLLEETLTESEKEERKDQAQALKKEGNDLYKTEEYADAIYKYTEAIKLCPLSFKKERSIMFANRAACKIHMKQLDDGIKDCTKALDLHPYYLKVLLRRAQTYELLEKLDDALTDYTKSLEVDPGCHIARAACMRLPGEINERNEKLKAEMMGKLKDLGNMVLRPFGLSTQNFNVQQDPNTGSYSMNFVQNNKGNNGK